MGADDVVQSFHLPKYTHVRLPSTPPPPGAVDKKDLELLEAESTPDYMTYDLEMMDVDESDLLETPNDGGMQEEEEESRIPKTMQELAEDAARKLQAVIRDQDAETWTRRKNLDGGDGEYRPSPPPPPSASKKVVKMTMPAGKAFSTADAGVVTRNGSATSNVKPKPKPKPKTRSTRALTRKRADYDSDHSDAVEEEKEKPSKRSRSAATISSNATPAPTRTLRPRVSKTRAQIEEERENEEAYRRAVDE